MKRKLLSLILAVLMVVEFSGCGSPNSVETTPAPEAETTPIPSPKIIVPDDGYLSEAELTLDFSFGTRTGIYSGEVDDNGLPNGQGKFSAKSLTGETWTYEGDWVAGHWEGNGTSTWANGQIYSGEFTNDSETGYGTLTLETGEKFEGTFISMVIHGDGTLYFPDGSYFNGTFTDLNNATGEYFDKDGTFLYEAVLEDGKFIYDMADNSESKNENDDAQEAKPSQTETVTLGQKNALSAAKQYLTIMAFSRSGLITQLEFEGFSTSEATYGADNCNADWNEQAAKAAKQYLDLMSFSRQGLIDQLKFDGFTSLQAEYGVSAAGY